MQIPTIAFPHAGGAGHNFRPLVPALRTLRIEPHDYPGHGRRVREPLSNDLEAIAADAFARHRAILESPHVLMGHSMGSRVALLVARLAQEQGLPRPLALVLSGSPAPGHEEREPIGHLPDDEFLSELAELGGLPPHVVDDPMIRELFMPILRADLAAIERWSPSDWRLDVPFIVLHGEDDESSPESARAWSSRTTSVCLFESLPGGHFFLYEDPVNAAAAIERHVSRILMAR